MAITWINIRLIHQNYVHDLNLVIVNVSVEFYITIFPKFYV